MGGYEGRIGPGCLAVILAPVLLITLGMASYTLRSCIYSNATTNPPTKTIIVSQQLLTPTTLPTTRMSEGKLVERMGDRR